MYLISQQKLAALYSHSTQTNLSLPLITPSGKWAPKAKEPAQYEQESGDLFPSVWFWPQFPTGKSSLNKYPKLQSVPTGIFNQKIGESPMKEYIYGPEVNSFISINVSRTDSHLFRKIYTKSLYLILPFFNTRMSIQTALLAIHMSYS